MPLFWPIVALGVLLPLELLACFRAPHLLAALAVLPVGRRREVVVAPGVRAVLTIAGEHEGGYRDSGVPRLDLARLPIAARFGGPGWTATTHLARHLVMVRASAPGRPLALAAIELWSEGDVVELRARFTPVPLLGLLTLGASLWLLASRAPWPSALAGALIIGSLVALTIASARSVRKAVDAAMDEIERALSGRAG